LLLFNSWFLFVCILGFTGCCFCKVNLASRRLLDSAIKLVHRADSVRFR
jgi:hypothetical protein